MTALGVAFGACSITQTGPAGSPSGGPYCFQEPGKPDACYPTQAERFTAQSQRNKAINDEQREKAEAEDVKAANGGEVNGLVRADNERRAERVAADKHRDEVFAERAAQRQRDDDANAARAAELKLMAADKAYAVPAISAIMCSIQDEIAALKADLAHEKRVTAIGGVVNLSARDEAANDIVDDTDELKTWGQALKRFSATQLPCKQVAPIVACRHKVETCDDASRGPAEVWDKEQATLWGSDKERPNR